MFHKVHGENRKDRTWEEICRDFPECHVVLEKPINSSEKEFSMFTIIEECNRKVMTWDDIREHFPDCHVALSEAQASDNVHCSGGVVAAYSETNNSASREEVVGYAVEHNFYLTQTYTDQSVLLPQHLIVTMYRTELGIMPDVFDSPHAKCSTEDPDFDRLL